MLRTKRFNKIMTQSFIELSHRVRRLHVDLQHLVILTFPRTQSIYKLYLLLRDDDHDCNRVFSSKLKTHPVYLESIIDHLDVPTKIERYCNGKLHLKKWLKKHGMYTREGDKPSEISYHENGQIESQSWWKNGRLHRYNNKSAFISYYPNGQIRCQSWWKDGLRHRDTEDENNKPAYITYNSDGEIRDQEWYINGKQQHGKQ